MTTVAEHATQQIPTMRRWSSVIGGLVALAMIILGFYLTQRQLDIKISEKTTELAINTKKEEFKLKSTYPGLVFIICGTVLGAVTIARPIHFITKHKDEKAGEPGSTEIKA